MNCKHCGNSVPVKRVQLGYTDCVSCSDVETYGYVNIINHKTGNEIQPLPKSQAAAINKIGDRKRFGTVLKGGSKSNTYNPKNTKYGCSTSFIGSEKLFEKVGIEAMTLLDERGLEAAIAYVGREVKELSISGSQAFQLRQILQVMGSEKQSVS
jgi:hypothetical protein